MQELLINSPVLQTLAITLIHFVWQGLLIAAVVKLLLIIISPMRPSLRYAVTSGAMIVSLLVPIITYFYCYQPVANSQSSAFSIVPIESFQQALQQNHSLAWYQQSIDYLPYIAVAWISWVLILTLRLLLDVTQVQRLPHRDTIEAEPQMLIRFEQLAKQVGLNKVPQLIISLKAEVPMAIGWLKPVVLMPAKMLMGLNQEQLEMLLLHELAHIRRHDYLVNFLQTLVEILLFFHPAVLWISKQMRQEREYCSDDIAVSHCGNPVAYAHTLADTAELCSKHRHATIPTMAMAASGGDLKARVHRIVNHSCSSDSDSGRWLAGITIAIAFFAIASKQFISIPLIDLSANLKLFSTASQQPEYQAQSNALAEFSIAQQLLEPQSISGKNKAPLVVVAEKVANNVNNLHIAEDLPATIEDKRTIQNQPQNVVTTTSHNASFATNQVNLQQKETRLPIKDVVIAKQEIVKPSKAEAAIATQSEENPYQQELVALTTEQPIVESKIEQLLTATPSQDQISPTLTLNEKVEPLFTNNSSAVSLFEQRYSIVKEEVNRQPIKLNAKAIKVVDPKYPSVAKRKGIELEVRVNFTINSEGRVSNIQFEQQSKLNYFKSSIISAIKKWRFEPAKENGIPVQSSMSKIFSFNLK